MNYAALLKAINTATAQLQGRAALAVNQALVLRNWRVGAWILEFEQHGKDRAKYGEKLCESLATDLKRKGLTGLDMRTLRDCRGFARHYPQIRGTVSPRIQVPAPIANSGDTVPRIHGWASFRETHVTSSNSTNTVSRYLVALPSAEKLRAFLEADRERIESLMPRPSASKRAPRKPKL
jgi:hypothetical protein